MPCVLRCAQSDNSLYALDSTTKKIIKHVNQQVEHFMSITDAKVSWKQLVKFAHSL
ncbi:hypothetical protein XM74_c21113 [Vibrio vulnificus]|nr:hypothetical protein XM74_c21113 [Vibrio vulnificus]